RDSCSKERPMAFHHLIHLVKSISSGLHRALCSVARPQPTALSWLCVAMMLGTGCGRTSVKPVPLPATSPTGAASAAAAPLAKPTRVVVYDFAVAAEDVALDRAVGAQLLQRLQGASQSEEQLKIGRATAQALSVELVKALRNLGFATERA